MIESPVYRNVLVPTDLSERALRALPHACALVAPGGTIHLVHVLERPQAANPAFAQTAASIVSDHQWEERRRQAEEALVALARSHPPARGVEVQRHVLEARHGLVVDRLCQAAGELEADLVCVASHGRSGLKRMLLGSVTEVLLRRCTVPTLVVRVPDRELSNG